ncbi:hypothetical protein J4230_03550 [Candidatus Woesearchaeota archaeon]|nr:hypothetical protein [Candidatus Woesearchaeota archaeon]
MVTKTTTSQEAKKKKKWISILASTEFNNQEIGETYVEEPEKAVGRTVETNLMMLSKDPKRQNFNVYFKIISITNNQAQTRLYAYNIQVAQLKRITKKSKNKIDDSFVYETKDGKKITIKPILITKTLTYKTTLKLIRKVCRDFLKEHIKKLTGSQAMKDIIDNVLQKEIKNAVKKITPVVNCTIKSAILND